VSRFKDHNPLGTLKIVSLMFEKIGSLRAVRETPKISNPTKQFLFNISKLAY
jgi:hypothetical protein